MHIVHYWIIDYIPEKNATWPIIHAQNGKWGNCWNILYLRYWANKMCICIDGIKTYYYVITLGRHRSPRRRIPQARNVKGDKSVLVHCRWSIALMQCMQQITVHQNHAYLKELWHEVASYFVRKIPMQQLITYSNLNVIQWPLILTSVQWGIALYLALSQLCFLKL